MKKLKANIIIIMDIKDRAIHFIKVISCAQRDQIDIHGDYRHEIKGLVNKIYCNSVRK